MALYADKITCIEFLEDLEFVFSNLVFANIDLNFTTPVPYSHERGLTKGPQGNDPAGNCEFRAVFNSIIAQF